MCFRGAPILSMHFSARTASQLFSIDIKKRTYLKLFGQWLLSNSDKVLSLFYL